MYISSGCTQAVTMMSWVEAASTHRIRHPHRDLTHFVISTVKGQCFYLEPPIQRYELAYTHKKPCQMVRQKHSFGLVLFLCAHAIYAEPFMGLVKMGAGFKLGYDIRDMTIPQVPHTFTETER